MRSLAYVVGLTAIWVMLWGSASPANVLSGLAAPHQVQGGNERTLELLHGGEQLGFSLRGRSVQPSRQFKTVFSREPLAIDELVEDGRPGRTSAWYLQAMGSEEVATRFDDRRVRSLAGCILGRAEPRHVNVSVMVRAEMHGWKKSNGRTE